MNSRRLKASLLLSTILIAGCPLTSEYVIEIKNNTQNQPFSPIALISSTEQDFVFTLGAPASTALEQLAEGGNNTFLLEQSYTESTVDIAQSGSGAILPGETETIKVIRINPNAKYLNLVSMLTRTNDGFIGEEINLSEIRLGKTYTFNATAWDAGTEHNTERAETLANVQGFNSSRDGDVNFIHTHPNVISNQDGLLDSALSANDRFLGAVASISIKRVK